MYFLTGLANCQATRLRPGGLRVAVDKVLAILGRAEADFVDLPALERRYGLESLCKHAVEKDRDFTPVILAEMLGAFGRPAA